MTMAGDHLLVLDVCGTEGFLHATARMDPQAAVIAMAHVEDRQFAHVSPSCSSPARVGRDRTAVPLSIAGSRGYRRWHSEQLIAGLFSRDSWRRDRCRGLRA